MNLDCMSLSSTTCVAKCRALEFVFGRWRASTRLLPPVRQHQRWSKEKTCSWSHSCEEKTASKVAMSWPHACACARRSSTKTDVCCFQHAASIAQWDHQKGDFADKPHGSASSIRNLNPQAPQQLKIESVMQDQSIEYFYLSHVCILRILHLTSFKNLCFLRFWSTGFRLLTNYTKLANHELECTHSELTCFDHQSKNIQIWSSPLISSQSAW